MSLIDYSKVPDEAANRLAQIRTAMINLSDQEIIEFAELNKNGDVPTVEKPAMPERPKSGSVMTKNFFQSSSLAQYLEENNVYSQTFQENPELRKSIALDMLRNLTEKQPQTPENYVRARDLALDQMKQDVFEAHDNEFEQNCDVVSIKDMLTPELG